MEKVETIHDRLKKARLQKYKSAYEFALSNDIPSGTYANHEVGNRGIKPHSVKKYANLLGVREAWLLTGEGPMYPQGFSESEMQNFTYANYKATKPKQTIHSFNRDSLTSAMKIAQEIIEKHRDKATIEDVTELAFRMLDLAQKWGINDEKVNAEMAEWLMTWKE